MLSGSVWWCKRLKFTLFVFLVWAEWRCKNNEMRLCPLTEPLHYLSHNGPGNWLFPPLPQFRGPWPITQTTASISALPTSHWSLQSLPAGWRLTSYEIQWPGISLNQNTNLKWTDQCEISFLICLIWHEDKLRALNDVLMRPAHWQYDTWEMTSKIHGLFVFLEVLWLSKYWNQSGVSGLVKDSEQLDVEQTPLIQCWRTAALFSFFLRSTAATPAAELQGFLMSLDKLTASVVEGWSNHLQNYPCPHWSGTGKYCYLEL